MKYYETATYLVIIHYTNFETAIRNVRKDKLDEIIEKLNKCNEVYDYVIARKMDFESE